MFFSKLLSYLNIPLAFPDFSNKKILVFRTAPAHVCKNFIRDIQQNSESVSVLTCENDDLKIDQINYFYYQGSRLNKNSLLRNVLKSIQSSQFDSVVVLLNACDFQDYEPVIKLALTLKSKNIYARTIFGDFVEINKLYFLKKFYRNALSKIG